MESFVSLNFSSLLSTQVLDILSSIDFDVSSACKIHPGPAHAHFFLLGKTCSVDATLELLPTLLKNGLSLSVLTKWASFRVFCALGIIAELIM